MYVGGDGATHGSEHRVGGEDDEPTDDVEGDEEGNEVAEVRTVDGTVLVDGDTDHDKPWKVDWLERIQSRRSR